MGHEYSSMNNNNNKSSMNKYREGRDGTGIFKNVKYNLKCSGS